MCVAAAIVTTSNCTKIGPNSEYNFIFQQNKSHARYTPQHATTSHSFNFHLFLFIIFSIDFLLLLFRSTLKAVNNTCLWLCLNTIFLLPDRSQSHQRIIVSLACVCDAERPSQGCFVFALTCRIHRTNQTVSVTPSLCQYDIFGATHFAYAKTGVHTHTPWELHGKIHK